MNRKRNSTREIQIGSIKIGGENPIAVQSMCTTHTQNIAETVAQIIELEAAGADIVRLAADNKRDAQALAEIRRQTTVNLSVDIQENYRLIPALAPYVDKIRYNPGHLYHHEPNTPWQDKVRFIADVAGEYDCALRVGVNCGSVDPAKAGRYDRKDSVTPMLESAFDHSELLDRLGFTRYAVSLKDSEPGKVIELNSRFAAERTDIPLHLGVTEAGIPPDGITKTRIAFARLISQGIGDTIRVSLTLPSRRKAEEVKAGREILADIAARRICAQDGHELPKLNIVSCPSCSRVENEAFVELACKVREMTRYAANHAFTIAVMGCRVNGPGETDDADLGLWCGPRRVNLKRRGEYLGAYSYDQILSRVDEELAALIALDRKTFSHVLEPNRAT